MEEVRKEPQAPEPPGETDPSGLSCLMKSLSTMAFMLLLLSTGIYSVPFAGITDTAETAYGQNFSAINNTFTVYLLASLVLGLPSNYIILKIGVYWSLTICSLLILSGTILRLLANSYSFSWMFVGQFISGIAPPLAQNGIFFYCHKMFSKSNAPIMLALMSLMNPLGTMIGFVLPYIFVDNTVKEPVTLKDQFFQYLLCESFIAGGILLVAALFVRNGTSPAKNTRVSGQSLQQGETIAQTVTPSLNQQPVPENRM